MSEIRKYKGIIVFFLILAILLFAKQSGSYINFSTNYKNDFVKEIALKHIPIFVFTKEIKHSSYSHILKKVSFENTILNITNFVKSLPSAHFISNFYYLSFGTLILMLNCILRI